MVGEDNAERENAFFERARETGERVLGMKSPLVVHHYDCDGLAAASIIASTEQNLRPSLPSLNDTRPSTSAKRVWSLPMPTFTPG